MALIRQKFSSSSPLRELGLVSVLACILFSSTACESETQPVDRTPLPSVAAEPYVCEHMDSDIPIPAKAVALMTGLDEFDLHDFGFFDLTYRLYGNSCEINDPQGRMVLEILVWEPGSQWREVIEQGVNGGGLSLPELADGSTGVYWAGLPGGSPRGPKLGRASTDNEAYAYLLLDDTELAVRLKYGAAGRDNAADVLAMMRLLAPKFITGVRPK